MYRGLDQPSDVGDHGGARALRAEEFAQIQQVAHYSNGMWTWTALPNQIVSIGAVAFVSNSEGFAAADIQSGTDAVSVMLHYITGVWSVIPG